MIPFRRRNGGKRADPRKRRPRGFTDRALRGKRSPLPGQLIKFVTSQLKSGTALALTATIVVAGIWLFVSFMVGIFWPRPMVVVQPFEISEEVAKEVHVSGKNAANIFVDRVNTLANEGSMFRGNAYSNSRHIGQVREMVKIPIESSFDFTIGGDFSKYCRIRFQASPLPAGPCQWGCDPDAQGDRNPSPLEP
jgi:hypothetical protein